MQNIDKIFKCMKNMKKERASLDKIHERKKNACSYFSDIDSHLKENAIKSIGNLKREALKIKQILDILYQCEDCSNFIGCSIRNTGDRCYIPLDLDMERYLKFVGNYLESETSIDQIDLFVDRFISAVYKNLEKEFRCMIETMPTLKTLLAS